jgi:cellulose biosynthesis protein BcsQ
MFNNKGGVGKTTLLCNLAAYLSLELNFKVLVVDCDPQCNTTQLIMGEDFASTFYWDQHSETVTTIADLLRPIQNGDASIAEEFQPISLNRNRFGVDLIAGHPSLSFLEDKLSGAWSEASAGEIGGYRKTNWARILSNKYGKNYDVILFDAGPSLGALNRSVLLGCDFFITPMGTDIFSILGIRNISNWLTDAIDTYAHGITACDKKTPKAFEFFSIPRHPSIGTGFIGFTLNQYLTKSKSGVRIATARYEEILARVPAELHDIRTKFGGPGITDKKAKLGDVPHMYSLIPLAQTRASPIISLTSKDGIVGSQYKMVEQYGEILKVIANNVVRNIKLKGGANA